MRPAAAAAGPSCGLSRSAVRAYVVQLVPQLSEDCVDACLTAPAGEPVRFHCPCFDLRHARGSHGGGAPKRTPGVLVVDKQKLVNHVQTATHVACKCL